MADRSCGHLERGAVPGIERRRGFTLLELIVVMTILAAMTGLVLPIYHDSFRSTKVANGASDFYATMQYTASIAISESTEYRVYVHPEENAYWVARFAGLDEDAEKVFVEVDDVYRGLTYLPAGLAFKKPKAYKDSELKGAYYVGFYPSGACDVATFEIAREGVRFRTYEIETHGRSGRMEMSVP